MRDNPKNRESSHSVIHSQIHACVFLFIYAHKHSSIPGLICIVGFQDILECISTQIHLFIHAQSRLFMHPSDFALLLHLGVLQGLINLVNILQFKIYHTAI